MQKIFKRDLFNQTGSHSPVIGSPFHEPWSFAINLTAHLKVNLVQNERSGWRKSMERFFILILSFQFQLVDTFIPNSHKYFSLERPACYYNNRVTIIPFCLRNLVRTHTSGDHFIRSFCSSILCVLLHNNSWLSNPLRETYSVFCA